MKKLRISWCLLFLGFSASSFVFASEITLNLHYTWKEPENYKALLLKADSNVTASCKSPLKKPIEVFSVSYDRFNDCDIRFGKLLVSRLYCGSNHHKNTKPLDFAKEEATTYYLIAFSREERDIYKPALPCITRGIYKTKLIVHFCDPVITPHGKVCTMKSCPLALGLGDGRIKDEQLSASSELDHTHAAKQGRASLIRSSHDSSWCAAPIFDLRSQHLQVDLLSIHAVSAVSTQGAVTEDSWVSSYLVHYSLDGKEWIVLTDKGEIKGFKGNSDQSSLVRHWLKPHFHARFVRFVPFSWVGHRCMRVEIHGCKKADTSLEQLRGNLKSAPRPCEAAYCASVPYSTCFMYSGKRFCKCVQSCALDLGKVCGTDGVTYQNECEMKMAACLSKKQINIYKRHPCACPEITCPPYGNCVHSDNGEVCLCPNCSPNGGKVCGSDGRTYNHSCELEKHAYPTVCAEKTCPPYANCIHSDSGLVCLCPNCAPKGSKVCGSDGRTYEHSCELEKHACKKNKSISIVSQGGCEVCAEKTCPPYANCVRSDGVVVCVCPNCSRNGGKVCGSDGRTYNHSCELEKHACRKNKNISIVSQGRCTGSKEKKPASSLKAFYTCLIVVALLGLAIALAMCLFQRAKSMRRTKCGKLSDLQESKNSSDSLHRKPQVEDNSKEDK